MSRPIKKIYDCATGETIEREFTDSELAQKAIDESEALARQAEAKAKAAQRQAILDRLGLTEDEAKLLLG